MPFLKYTPNARRAGTVDWRKYTLQFHESSVVCVTKAKTPEEARSQLLNIYMSGSPFKPGTDQDHKKTLEDMLADVNKAAKYAEDLVVADLKLLFPQLKKDLTAHVKAMATGKEKYGFSENLYRHHNPLEGSTFNAYLFDRVPQLQRLIDSLNKRYASKRIRVYIDVPTADYTPNGFLGGVTAIRAEFIN